nr:uncharacterized protein LOC119713036 isoform X1 [Anas platyrhynchos]
MRQGRAAGLAALAAVLLVAVCRAQVQQEPWAETREGTSINITCSHPNIQTGEVIHWYRHLPGQGPAFLMSAFSGSRELTDLPGWLVVAADRRSSALWLTKPRLRDAAVYYCALRATGRGAGAAAVQEPWRAGPGVCGGGEAGAQPPGGAAAPPARTTSSRSRGGSPASPAPPRHFGSAERVWSLGAAERRWQQPARGHAQKDSVVQFAQETAIQVGHNATLHCNFSTSTSTPYIFWYQQRLTQSPQFLLQKPRGRCPSSSKKDKSPWSMETPSRPIAHMKPPTLMACSGTSRRRDKPLNGFPIKQEQAPSRVTVSPRS